MSQAPKFTRTRRGGKLIHYGFSRRPALGKAEREWTVDGDRFSIEDRLEGTGSHRICRRYVVCGNVTVDGPAATVKTGGRIYRIEAETEARKIDISRWDAYGSAAPATIIEYHHREKLPCRNQTVIERLGTGN